MGPNLFTFATTELSQDAVLCWLLAWADPKHSAGDLRPAGADLLRALFAACGHYDVPLGPVRIHRQLDFVDVVAEIGDRWVVAIEDKVHAMARFDRMREYIKAIEDRFPKHEIGFLYVKTGDEASYAEVRASGWQVITRERLLEVLRPHARPERHGVLDEFVRHLEAREGLVSGFRTRPIADWWPRGPMWHGFYDAIVARLGVAR